MVTYRMGSSETVIGRVLPKLLHLGVYITGNGANGPEVDTIIETINIIRDGAWWDSVARQARPNRRDD